MINFSFCNERLAAIRAVIELQPFGHASRKGKIRAIKCTKAELVVARFFQVLHDRILLKRPQLDPQQQHDAKHRRHH